MQINVQILPFSGLGGIGKRRGAIAIAAIARLEVTSSFGESRHGRTSGNGADTDQAGGAAIVWWIEWDPSVRGARHQHPGSLHLHAVLHIRQRICAIVRRTFRNLHLPRHVEEGDTLRRVLRPAPQLAEIGE